jgi:hypothetical protein
MATTIIVRMLLVALAAVLSLFGYQVWAQFRARQIRRTLHYPLAPRPQPGSRPSLAVVDASERAST